MSGWMDDKITVCGRKCWGGLIGQITNRPGSLWNAQLKFGEALIVRTQVGRKTQVQASDVYCVLLLQDSIFFTKVFLVLFFFYINQDDHFKGLTNLRHLILANNQLHSISPHAFDDFLSTLEDLDLSYNNLDQVPWDTIGRLTNVNTLNMDHNLIENVPQGVFTNLHKLAR